jgi:hypothetical protein
VNPAARLKRAAYQDAPTPGQDPERDRPVLARLAALKAMSVVALKAHWRELFGTEAPNNSRPFLLFRLGYRIQELAYGGLPKTTVKILDALADEYRGVPVRKPMLGDSRRPLAGTRLVREWAGVEHTVTVLRDGFEHEGRCFKSLSAIARAITGTQWNGWRFFGLGGAQGRGQGSGPDRASGVAKRLRGAESRL